MFRHITFAALAAVALALLISSSAAAKPPLRDNAYINDQLFAAAVADELRKRCSSVEARMVKVRTDGLRLFNYALNQGYTRAEISDYLESKPDIARMEARRDAYLRSHGVRTGDEASYCRHAEREMAAGSLAGSLLRKP